MSLENKLKDHLKSLILKLSHGDVLNEVEMRDALDIIMRGNAGAAQIGAFLMALKLRGEHIDEITAAARYLRERMTRVALDGDESVIMDIVGTGGDGSCSYNISTCTALVVAACGVRVAKHGNRAISSRCGAADILLELGVKTDLSPHGVARCISEAGIGFMFAPMHHAAMRHVGPVRSELGMRTLFNLLGPLVNPALATHYLLGVFASEWVEPIAHVLHNLGAKSAMVVHGVGADGEATDEVTVTGTTHIAQLQDGSVRCYDMTPESLGFPVAKTEDIRGGDSVYNAAALRGVLHGTQSAYRDMVVMNAAAALVVAGKVSRWDAGADMARERIDNGQALAVLDRLVQASQGA